MRDPNDRNNKILVVTKEEIDDLEGIQIVKRCKEEGNIEPIVERLLQYVYTNDRQTKIKIVRSSAKQQLSTDSRAYADYRWVFSKHNYTHSKAFENEGDGSVDGVKCNILIMYVGKDVVIPKEAVTQYKELLGDKVILREVEGAGHVLIGTYDDEEKEPVKQVSHF